ncbi:MAG: enoyl-CoA hydratase/isomerase family protein [Candidatus Acidiferrales bacterium]
MSSGLRATRHADIFLLTLEHPSGFPRLTREVLCELLCQLDALASATECVGIVITGSPQAFCAGAEIEEIAALAPGGGRAFSELGQSVMSRIANAEKPIVAAIRGYCMGGGFDLALACHTRIATDDAVFAHRGATLGLITGWGGTQRLARLIGRARATEVFVTARPISAGEALRLGLLREVTTADELLPHAIDLARNPRATENGI